MVDWAPTKFSEAYFCALIELARNLQLQRALDSSIDQHPGKVYFQTVLLASKGSPKHPESESSGEFSILLFDLGGKVFTIEMSHFIAIMA